jgi:hypothetical protein
MGLFRATVIAAISLFIFENVKKYDTILDKIPVVNKVSENKINYCYLLIGIVFFIELIF